MDEDLVICTDMGTTHIKSGAFTADGRMVSLAAADAPPLEHQLGFLSFPADRYMDLVIRTLWEATAALPDPGRVRALALTNQRATVVPARADGRPAGPALSWEDTSGEAAMRAFAERLGHAVFVATTGLPPSALWTLAKLLRLRDVAPDCFAGADAFVTLHDFALRALGADDFLCDPSNASATGLMDVRTCRWSPRLLEAAGLNATRLPRLVPPGTRANGGLAPAVARATGLPPGLPLVVGGGDQQCAALGLGALEPGDASLCLGTAAVLSCPLAAPQPDAAGRFFCTAHVLPGRWVLEGIHNAFGASLQWAAGALGAENVAALGPLLDQSPPGANGARFLPFLSGIGSPDYQAAVAGTFLGLRPTHTRADLARAVCEGVLMETRRILDSTDTGAAVRRVRVGGAAPGGVLTPLLADMLGREVALSRAAEPTLLGAAALAWAGIGGMPDLAQAARRLAGPADIRPPSASAARQAPHHAAYRRDVAAAIALYQERTP